MGVPAPDFDQEILPHLDLLYRVALRFTREPARAEDLVQDTLLKAFRIWEKFQPGTSARAWLLAIMRNTFINLYRREKREPIPIDLRGAGHPYVAPARRGERSGRRVFRPDRG